MHNNRDTQNIAQQKLAIARNFSRAANTYDSVAILQQEIGQRLLDRLDFIKIQPEVILDLGGGTGFFSRALQQKFPNATLYNLDIAEGMLQIANTANALTKKVCGDVESLPFKSESVDFIFSNCTFQWFLDPVRALLEIQRVLKPDGLLLFSTFGPDTLKELRESYQALDSGIHVNHFLDMHDIGDLLLHTQFIDPVMDMENLTLTYQTCQELLKDLKETGANTVNGRSVQGLKSACHLQKLQGAYECYRNSDGLLPATFEVVYGHAFANEFMQTESMGENTCKSIPIEYLP